MFTGNERYKDVFFRATSLQLIRRMTVSTLRQVVGL
jgi:hypothetical protein